MKDKLTPKQEQAIDLLLVHFSVGRVSTELAVAASTLWRWQQEPLFQQRYREARRVLTERSGAMLQQASQLAAQRLIEMIDDENVPAQIQLAACVKVLEFAYKSEEVKDIQESIEELKAMLNADTSAQKGLRAV